MCYNIHVEMREQFLGISFLVLCESQGLIMAFRFGAYDFIQ